MDKTATEVVLQLVASGMQKEAGILTSPIRKFFRSRTYAGDMLNEALNLRANRPKINKEIAIALRSHGDTGNDIAKAFNTARPRDKFTVLVDAWNRRADDLINRGRSISDDDLLKDLLKLRDKYDINNKWGISNALRKANGALKRTNIL